ncbi:monovalent cation/H(+) antiporter subunit G [Sphingobium sp. B11D3D]|uniref:monovalent cation/H(+) antiporter subunit G n=1 Tax=Sphingobium sp. B11D3D TaxID=2940576 RepID=UPI0022245B9B|nr:monovalent cation/H(+) antiporter subunit G [Sphingobium sp. B11D3D]MCW2368440.1 multicomponent Na+:H+ antiporter subunit G [Sphingobium sp. B11D3D]
MMILAMALLITGTAFLLIAAIGIVRLRDPLQRMHSATKAGTLGATLMLLGVVLAADIAELNWTSGLTILFLLITLPIGAQLLGRAAYVSGTRLEGLAHDPLSDELERHPGKPDELTRDS